VPHHRNSGKDWLWEPTRQAIYLRDGDRCVACDHEGPWFLTVDHVDPRGGHAPSNLATLCVRCNSQKRSLSLEEWATPEIAARVRRAAAEPLTDAHRVVGRARAMVVRPRRVVARRERDLNRRSRARMASLPAAEAPF
jgi:hypothetical protein